MLVRLHMENIGFLMTIDIPQDKKHQIGMGVFGAQMHQRVFNSLF